MPAIGNILCSTPVEWQARPASARHRQFRGRQAQIGRLFTPGAHSQTRGKMPFTLPNVARFRVVLETGFGGKNQSLLSGDLFFWGGIRGRKSSFKGAGAKRGSNDGAPDVWPEFFSKPLDKLTRQDCQAWYRNYCRDFSVSRSNSALGILNIIFK